MSLGFKMKEQTFAACFAWSVWMPGLKRGRVTIPLQVERCGHSVVLFWEAPRATLGTADITAPSLPLSRALPPPPHLGTRLRTALLLSQEAGQAHLSAPRLLGICSLAAKPQGAVVIQNTARKGQVRGGVSFQKYFPLPSPPQLSISSLFPTLRGRKLE